LSLNIYKDNTNNQITISDLATIKELINLACTRGAFRGEEMTSVGEVYDKLTGFLDTVIAAAQAEANQQGEAQ
jgi:hypothetical protein